MNCPNCGRRNASDAAYCARCGFRLPTAAGRGAGITYRRTEQAEPHGGGGQGLLAFGAVLLAGLLFVGGALALFLSGGKGATPAPSSVANASPTSSLEIFIQPTATPPPPPTPTPVPSFFGVSPTIPVSFPIDSPTLPIGPTPTPTIVPPPTPTPTATPPHTPRPTPTPTDTPPPTPQPTPANCDGATGTPTKYLTLNSQATTRTVPANKVWCLDGVRIEPGPNYGHVKLMLGSRLLFQADCDPGTCDPRYEQVWAPDEILVKPGKSLTDVSTCVDDPLTVGFDECTDPTATPGAVITIGYEVFPAP